MKLSIVAPDKKAAGDISLPGQFTEPVRTDLITRAVLALQAARRQPYGGFGNAGLRHSSDLSRRRRKYRGSYGKGISRVPRKILSRRGSQMHMVGATAPGMVGGRKAHPPKSFKDWTQKINAIENRKAIRAALAATVQADIITERGHQIPKEFPFILSTDLEKISKTTDLEKALVQLGFAEELARGSTKRIRAGKGKLRGRKHKNPVSFLFVVSKTGTPLAKAASNIPGADVAVVHGLNAELLAPGCHPGRLTIFTEAAVKRLADESLFTKNYKVPEKKPAVKKAPAKKAPAKVKA